MSAFGPNPCLAPYSASISRITYTFGVTSLFVCLNCHLQRRTSECSCWDLALCSYHSWATAKIIIMSAFGPNPCLVPSCASVSKHTIHFCCKFVCLLVLMDSRIVLNIILQPSWMSNNKTNNHERIGAQTLPGAMKCIDLKNNTHLWSFKV